ncbi:translocation/assembly module TamB domain-containing protein [Ferruginivarius sediminum]|uniref:Translocation and assembly module TamB C-terminal domain-containing protein n=1 Tax=Ferruginivarius sediminum TaxID=2661937 RepID=A0A369T913_9PROT|nr:translocation/assembly module TamB domain-containing protein [Ferruginivarius sediminum]RDD61811.1 hypothetical protein DRB17_11535 [Ferruginivarius sediminum]
MTRVRRALKLTAILCGGLLAVILMLVLATWAAVNTERGQAWLQDRLEKALAEEGAEAEVSGLSGPLPQRLALDRLVLRDPDGVWLTLESAEVAWRPMALFAGRMEIARIHAGQIHLARLPEGAAEEEPAPAEPFALPRLPVPIRLDSLSVERLELGEAVLGEAATFAIDGQAAAPAAGALTSRLRVERLDAPGGILTARAEYTPDERNLGVDAELSGAAGGLLAGALNLDADESVSASLSGNAPIDDWRGRAEARLGADASITADLALEAAKRATIDGQADVQAILPPDIARLIGGAAEFGLTLSRKGKSGANIERARIATPNATMQLTGTLDGDAGTIDAHGDVDILTPEPFATLAGLSNLIGAKADFQARGPLSAPKLEAAITADRLALPDVSADAVEIAAKLDPDDTMTRGRLTAKVTSGTVDLAGPEFAGFSGAPLTVDLAGDLDLDAMTLSAMTATLDGPDLTARFQGSVDLATGVGDTAFELEIGKLASLNPMIGLVGQGKLNGHLAFGGEDSLLQGTVAGDLRDVTWGAEPILDTLAGGAVSLATDINLADDGALTLRNLSMESGNARIAGELGFPASFDTIDGAFDVALPETDILSEPLGTRLSGAASGTVRLSGPTADPGVEAGLEIADAAVEGTPFGLLKVQVTARQLASKPNGSIDAEASATMVGAVRASTDFALTGAAFQLAKLDATGSGFKVSGGRLSAPLEGGVLTGGADVEVTDLAKLGQRFDLPLSGTGRVSVSLGAGSTGQGVTLDGRLTDVTYGGDATAGTLELKAEVDDAFANPGGTARIALANATAGPAKLDAASLRVDGGPAKANLRLEASGEAFGPLQVSADASVALEGAVTQLTLTRLNADTQGKALSLERPAVLRLEPASLTLSDLAVQAEGGTLRLDLERTAERIDATAQLESLPLALTRLVLAEPKLSGNLDGRMELSGPLARPEGSFQFNAAEIGLEGADLPPLDAWLQGRISGGTLTASGQARGLSETPVQLSVQLPMRLSLAPVAAGLPPDGPVRAEVSWQGDVAPLMPFVPVSGHRLTGQGDVALRIEGSLGDPQPRGHIALTGATYENLTTGTLLTDLNARIEGDGEALQIARFEARDGGKGSVMASGSVNVYGGAGQAVDLTLTAKNATLVRRDEITARTDLDLAVTGPFDDLLLQGVVTVERGEARIPDSLPPEVASLDVVEVGGDSLAGAEPPKTPESESESEAAKPSRIKLDIAVDVPSRFFMRGGGLDSEWSGNLAVTGTADQPVINGQLRAVRGQVDFLGKAFKLNRGEVDFDGGSEIDPSITAEAFHSGRDIDVTVAVSGPAQQPELTLSSTPELPQDEVISRLLFGKSATELSAMEAGQLGLAVAQLTTGGGGAGILDRIRGLVGVDVLSVGSTEAGDPSVTAGKYIGGDVFVGVEQGASTESSSAKVEVDLTDNIAVESRVGATGSSEVGIQFKWDY